MNYDERYAWVSTTARVLDELQYMTDTELALAYADYLEHLEGDGFFIQEMQARGLDFTDLEQLLINHEEGIKEPCGCGPECARCGGACDGPYRCPCRNR